MYLSIYAPSLPTMQMIHPQLKLTAKMFSNVILIQFGPL